MKSILCFATALLFSLAAFCGELQEAAGRGDLEKVRALIKANPASVNVRDRGTTALHEATRAGHLDVVKLLVASGASVNATDFSGLTPLRLAMGRRSVEVADFLRQNGGVEQVAPASPGKVAVSTVPPNVAGVGTAKGPLFATNVPITATQADRNSGRLATKSVAAPPMTNALPASEVVTNKLPSEREMMPVLYPIHEAARVGDDEYIKLLFKNSPDIINAIDDKGLTALHVAAANKQFAVARTLVGLRAKLNARSVAGQTPLHVAVRHDDVAITGLLLTNRATVDVPDNLGNTPLLLALQSSDAEVLDGGGGLAERNSHNDNLTLSTLKRQQFQLAAMLVKAGANVNARNQVGATPLTEAVRLGNEPTVELLLAAGASPDVSDPITRKTPLHVAAARGHRTIVEALVRHRATVDSVDGRGETPLCYALRAGKTNTVAVLRAAGATTGQPRALNATEQSLVAFYQRTEVALQRGTPADKARTLVAVNPTKAECDRMFPKYSAHAWRVVDVINKQIKLEFAKPVRDAEEGKEIWRVLPEAPSLMVQQWRARGDLSSELPVYSLAVDKIGSSSRPGDYCFVNGRWVVMPPLQMIAAQIASVEKVRH